MEVKFEQRRRILGQILAVGFEQDFEVSVRFTQVEERLEILGEDLAVRLAYALFDVKFDGILYSKQKIIVFAF